MFDFIFFEPSGKPLQRKGRPVMKNYDDQTRCLASSASWWLTEGPLIHHGAMASRGSRVPNWAPICRETPVFPVPMARNGWQHSGCGCGSWCGAALGRGCVCRARVHL